MSVYETRERITLTTEPRSLVAAVVGIAIFFFIGAAIPTPAENIKTREDRWAFRLRDGMFAAMGLCLLFFALRVTVIKVDSDRREVTASKTLWQRITYETTTLRADQIRAVVVEQEEVSRKGYSTTIARITFDGGKEGSPLIEGAEPFTKAAGETADKIGKLLGVPVERKR